MTENLMEGVIRQMNRCRELLTIYEEIPNGAFGAAMIKQEIARAEKAIGTGDVLELLQVYHNLQECQ